VTVPSYPGSEMYEATLSQFANADPRTVALCAVWCTVRCAWAIAPPLIAECYSECMTDCVGRGP